MANAEGARVRSSALETAIVAILLCVVGCGPGYSDFEQSIGGSLTYVSAGPLDKYILRGSEVIVGNLVVGYDYDAEWVIALRLVAYEMECEPGPTADYDLTGEREFWIISKTSGAILGPLARDEYLHRRAELNVPISLRLDESEAARAYEYAKRLQKYAGDRPRDCRRVSGNQ